MAALPSKDWENLPAQDPLEPSSETVKNYTSAESQCVWKTVHEVEMCSEQGQRRKYGSDQVRS